MLLIEMLNHDMDYVVSLKIPPRRNCRSVSLPREISLSGKTKGCGIKQITPDMKD